MHGAAFAFAVAGPFAIDLGHHFPHIRALGDAVPVAAVMADDAVFDAEVLADSGGDGLLAYIGMDETSNVSGTEFIIYPLFEPTDREHGGIQINQSFSIKTQ